MVVIFRDVLEFCGYPPEKELDDIGISTLKQEFMRRKENLLKAHKVMNAKVSKEMLEKLQIAEGLIEDQMAKILEGTDLHT